MFTALIRVNRRNTIMNVNTQTQVAISTLSQAFAPLRCVIIAARNDSFSFSVVNEHGVARHTQRLYPEQYAAPAPLQAVIERARQSLVA
jgi:hypothetical protein